MSWKLGWVVISPLQPSQSRAALAPTPDFPEVGASPTGGRPKTVNRSGRLVQGNIQPIIANKIIQRVAAGQEGCEEGVGLALFV